MFGVHSAMPSSVARRLCPDAVFLDGRFHRYVEESERLHAILASYTPLVEGISLDEAFLDVSGAVHLFGSGATMGPPIRARVRDEMRLGCSVGVGRSKLMAKLASKAAKPRASRSGIEPGPGVVEVPADGELDFLHPVAGAGPVGDRPGHREAAARPRGDDGGGAGRDARPSRSSATWGWRPGDTCRSCPGPSTTARSCPSRRPSRSVTRRRSPTDLWDLDDLHRRLQRMVDASATALRRAERATRTVTVKLRFGDFTQMTRSHTLDGPVDATPAIGAVAGALLESVDLSRGVRLLGVSLSGLADPGEGTQLRLDLETERRATGTGGAAASTARVGGGRPEPAAAGPARGLRDAGREAERLQQSWGSVTSSGRRHPGPLRRRVPWVRRPWSPRRGSGSASGARPSGGRARPGAAGRGRRRRRRRTADGAVENRG